MGSVAHAVNSSASPRNSCDASEKVVLYNAIGEEKDENCDVTTVSFGGTNIFGIPYANLEAGAIRRKNKLMAK